MTCPRGEQVSADIPHKSVSDVLLGRQSPVTLREPGPGRDAVDAMLRAAMCAPDHGRLKPWRFLLITGEARHAFGAILAEALRRRQPGIGQDVLARERAKALRAPLIIVVIAMITERKGIPAVEQIVAAGIAANNILLTACSLGYGGMWRTGDHAYDPFVHRAMGVDAPGTIVGFLYLGTPDAMPRPRELPAIEDFVGDWHGAGSITKRAATHAVDGRSYRAVASEAPPLSGTQLD